MMTTDGRKSPVHVHVDRETPVHVHLKKKKKGKPGVPTAVEVCRVHPIKNNDCNKIMTVAPGFQQPSELWHVIPPPQR